MFIHLEWSDLFPWWITLKMNHCNSNELHQKKYLFYTIVEFSFRNFARSPLRNFPAGFASSPSFDPITLPFRRSTSNARRLCRSCIVALCRLDPSCRSRICRQVCKRAMELCRSFMPLKGGDILTSLARLLSWSLLDHRFRLHVDSSSPITSAQSLLHARLPPEVSWRDSAPMLRKVLMAAMMDMMCVS